jgi:chemotaxis protein methyltransferase CheR
MAQTPARPGSLIHAYITTRTGMALSDNQRRRLDERLAVLKGSLSEQQYLLHLQTPAGAAELSALVSVVAVHKTDLFRDEVQLGAFRSHVLDPLVAQSAGRPLRMWSAGCATGEEVATLLILMDEAGADADSTVLGTDISEAALNRARTLSFSAEQVRRLTGPARERYFMPDGTRSLLVPELRERAVFQHHNLVDAPYPASAGEGFDVIFCRNVLIYFTPEAFDRVVRALAERLAPGGTLVLSSAEPLLQAPPSLRVIRSDHAFFYVRTPSVPTAPPVRVPQARDSGRFAAVSPEPARRDSGRFAAVSPEPARRDSGRFAAISSEPRRDSGSVATVQPGQRRDSGRFASVASMSEHPEEQLIHAEADSLFALVLEGVGEGDSQTEDYLRRCLALDPDLSAARYLLGMMLELREAFPEAATEYRKALRSLEEGKARPTPFFLNHARLRVACQKAIQRMEAAGKLR